VIVAPAGWYPDPQTPPFGPPSLRYWDGAAWTEHLAPGHAAYPAGGYAPAAAPTTPDGVPLASWGMRVAAHLIDTVLVGGVSLVVSLPQQIEMQRRLNELTTSMSGDPASVNMGAFWRDYLDIMRDQMWMQVPLMLLSVAYFVVMLRWKGATIGKLAVGLRVRLRDEPGQLPWRAIAIRVAILNVLGAVPIMLLAVGWWQVGLVLWLIVLVFIFVDLLRPLWNSKRQAFHDAAARTNVVKVR
jgi:uncharacterized RDD family membrane protein YckC